jgi:hypothetical protein
MRFRPSGGLGHIQQRPDREAVQARAEAVGEQPMQERVYDKRHTHEIERAENIAAGLPPEGVPPEGQTATKRDFREPNLETPAEVQEEKNFEPVPVPEPSRGIVESIKVAATNLVKKVQRLIKPVKRAHKEVVINAESLETRVAVLEEGRL